MKAALAVAPGAPFEVHDLVLADPSGPEVLVEVRASGLCHTDLTYARTGLGYPFPCVLGHEVAGTVLEVGPDVTDLQAGQRVVACLVQYCGRCRFCQSGRPGLCRTPDVTRPTDAVPRLSRDGGPVSQGYGIGGFAERALVHRRQLVRVPDELPFVPAALLGCAGVTGLGAVLNVAQVQVGQTVVVIGVGGVGLNAISGAVLAGATRIVAVDRSAVQLERGRVFGATDVVDASEVDAAAAVLDLLGDGADAVFDFVGVPAVTQAALGMVAPDGGLYLVGSADPSATFSVTTMQAIAQRKRIQGVRMGSTVPQRDIPDYAELYLRGRLNLDGLASAEIALSDINLGYEQMEGGTQARVVITSF